MIWFETAEDTEAQKLQDYAEFHEKVCMYKLRKLIPGLSKNVAKCICYAAIEKEEYALDLISKAGLEEVEMFSLLQWAERIEQCAYEEEEERDSDNNHPMWNRERE